jgi:hypothetical protein
MIVRRLLNFIVEERLVEVIGDIVTTEVVPRIFIVNERSLTVGVAHEDVISQKVIVG